MTEGIDFTLPTAMYEMIDGEWTNGRLPFLMDSTDWVSLPADELLGMKSGSDVLLSTQLYIFY